MSRKGKLWAALGVLLFVCVVIWAVRTAPQPPQKAPVEDGPKVMSYDNNTISEEKDGKKIWELTSESMTVDVDTKNVELTGLSGKFYEEDGRVVSVTAAHGTYDNKTKDIQVAGDVTIETRDGAALTCGKLLWTEAEGKLTAAEDAYIKQDDMQARADRIESTNGFSHFKAIGKAHIVKGAK